MRNGHDITESRYFWGPCRSVPIDEPPFGSGDEAIWITRSVEPGVLNVKTVGKFTRTRLFSRSLEGGGDYRILDSGSVETAVRQEGFVRPLLVPPTEALVRGAYP